MNGKTIRRGKQRSTDLGRGEGGDKSPRLKTSMAMSHLFLYISPGARFPAQIVTKQKHSGREGVAVRVAPVFVASLDQHHSVVIFHHQIQLKSLLQIFHI